MSEELKNMAEGAAKGIAEAVPVYDDLLKPASQELGKSLNTLAKTVNVALSPLAGLVWGYEKISAYVQKSLEAKLKNVPPEDIITPDISIAGPTLEAMRYTAHKEDLREMFVNILATSMSAKSQKNAHPSFVEILKQLNSDEALIIKSFNNNDPKPILKVRIYGTEDKNYYSEPLVNFSGIPYISGCLYPELGPSYIENLERLSLVDIDYNVYHTVPNSYDFIENHEVIREWKAYADSIQRRIEIMQGVITITPFGEVFISTCVKES
ncbi:DUF4393 domain-containing protein [Bacillus sp. FJAT-18017]|uniref:DUF4393 domain-containing protein n=1 Tax=Bacillus sp. FJAT-18017 TaxID=1705566 RepID=UPI0006ADC98A|nr:DUF4393 domain-containing protein [Bacillus sp. FJAT-18017]